MFLKNGKKNISVNVLENDSSIRLQCYCNVSYFSLTLSWNLPIINKRKIQSCSYYRDSIRIVLEYEEIIQHKYGIATANAFIKLLKELPNVHYITSWYKWQLIKTDPDDNKYCDCAIAGKASFLVTEDKHFTILKSVSFPKLTPISIEYFLRVLKNE